MKFFFYCALGFSCALGESKSGSLGSAIWISARAVGATGLLVGGAAGSVVGAELILIVSISPISKSWDSSCAIVFLPLN